MRGYGGRKLSLVFTSRTSGLQYLPRDSLISASSRLKIIVSKTQHEILIVRDRSAETTRHVSAADYQIRPMISNSSLVS